MISMEDRMAVLDLCANYNFLFDSGEAQAFADTFIPEGTFESPSGRSNGHEELAAFCREFHEKNPGGMHFNDNHIFEIDGERILHKCYLSMQVPTEGMVANATVSVVVYHDVIVRTPNGLKFQSRHVKPMGA